MCILLLLAASVLVLVFTQLPAPDWAHVKGLESFLVALFVCFVLICAKKTKQTDLIK